MKSAFLGAAVLALAASTCQAQTFTNCNQATQQIQQLNQQIDQTQQQAASCAAGGAIEPYNPTWAPWPIHAWPDASKHTCVKMQAHATLIQQENGQAIASLQQAMNSAGCS